MNLQGDIETSPVFKMYNHMLFGLRCANSMNSSSIWFMVYPWHAMTFFWSKSGPTTESSGINLKKLVNVISGQIIIFHQPRFPWNEGNSCPQLPFRVRSCEVAIIWPDIWLTQGKKRSSYYIGLLPKQSLEKSLKKTVDWKQCILIRGNVIIPNKRAWYRSLHTSN